MSMRGTETHYKVLLPWPRQAIYSWHWSTTLCVNPDCNPWKVLGTHAHASAAEVKAEESSAFLGHKSKRLIDLMDLHGPCFAHCGRSGSCKSSSEAFKRQALALHPDKGGSKEAGDVNTIGGSEINCGLGDGKRSKAFQRALRAFEALVSDFAYQQIFLLCYCVILILLGSVWWKQQSWIWP